MIEPIADSAPSSKPDAATPASEEPPAAPGESELQEPRTDAGPRPEGGHRREVSAKEAVEDATQPRTEPSIALEPASGATEPAPAVEIAPARAGNRAGDTGGGPSLRGDDAHNRRRRPHHHGTSDSNQDRYHVVRPGESLWLIAADLLDDRATVPRIAREVNRLWELNNEVIGTGRPDLLFAGTRLRLR